LPKERAFGFYRKQKQAQEESEITGKRIKDVIIEAGGASKTDKRKQPRRNETAHQP
jgi:hypothetical protein